MNKNAIQKMMIAAIACIALCGTTLAAPAHKPAQGRAPHVAVPAGKPSAGGYPAPQVQKANRPAPVAQKAHKPAPAPHKAVAAKPMPKPAPQIAHHHAPVHHTAPRRPVTPCHRHHRHECHDCHYDDNGWVELGAGIIGGIIGALIAG